MSFAKVLLVMGGLVACSTTFGEDRAVFDNGAILTLPSVDTPDQVGKYQDVTFQWLSPPQNTWALTSLQMLGTPALAQVPVNTVEVVKTGSLPAGVYLRASGTDSRCDSGPGRIHQRLVGTRFEVDISALHTAPSNGTQGCTQNVRSFKITVPLQVYGLAAGTYSYSVNGITGTFALDSDNKFAGDCDLTAQGMCL
jgi:hypothetical protein